MKSEFMIDRHGKTFVLFVGLIDEAHRRGLKSIDTELIQAPSADNGGIAICKARVELEGGLVCHGYGDASKENVAKAMATRLVAMSETRAKARALRDALNISATALEELADDEAPAQLPTKQNGKDLQNVGAASVSVIRDDGVTARQLEELASLARRRNFSDASIDKKWAIWERYSYVEAAEKIAEQEAILDGEVHRSG